MKALLLGGTGAMGCYLQDELLMRGWEVFVTSRKARKSRKSVTFIQGNAKDPVFLAEALGEGYNAVVDFMTWSPRAFHSVVASMLGSTERYVFLSSYRVFADAARIVEDSPRLLEACPDKKYRTGSEYAIVKAQEEDMLRSASSDNWTIVRPSITFSGGGTGRFQLCTYECNLWLWRALNGLSIPVVPEMMGKQCTLTWAGDVARMIALLVDNPEAAGEDFNTATSQHQTWGEILELYRSVLAVETSEVSLESYESHCGPALKEYGYVPQVRYDRMISRVLDNSKVLEYTGLCSTDLSDIRKVLPRELSVFLSRDSHLMTSPTVQGRLDRISRSSLSLRGVLKEFGALDSMKYFMGKHGLV